MSAFALQLIDDADLTNELTNLYWDIKELCDKYRPKDRETNCRVLDEVSVAISRNESPSAWPGPLCQRFMMTACALAREALLFGSADGAGMLTPARRASILCSFAARCPHLPLMGKLQVGSVWVMTALVSGPPLEDPDQAYREARAALDPLQLPPDDAHDQVRAQIVLHVARLLEARALVNPVAESTARQWCADLLAHDKLVNILPRAARTLNVPLPQRDPFGEPRFPAYQTTDRGVAACSAVAASASAESLAPAIWPIPEPLTASELQQEFLACLLKLQATARIRGTPISPRTAEGLFALGPRTDLSACGRVVYFSGRELWRSFTLTGNREHVDLARRVARLAFFGAPDEGEKRERSGALALWMNAHLPDLLASHTFDALLTDAARVWARVGCRPSELVLRQGILEAHAGLCRELEATGQCETRERFLAEKLPLLRALHAEFQRLVGSSRYRPSEEMLLGWEYLNGVASGPVHPAGPAAMPETILLDPALRDCVRRGSSAELHEYARTHRERIESLLAARLAAPIGFEHLSWPEGTVRSTRGLDNKYPDPDFLAARDLLDQSNFEQAALAFRRTAERLAQRGGPTRPSDICRNYEAYAHARRGEPTLARVCLKELVDGGFPFASAYWNYACCLPAEDDASRLAILERGLQHAPHPLTLCGLIGLAIHVGDVARLRRWLPCLVETEAVLLTFLLEYPELDASRREQGVLRLAQYLRDGVEPLVLDPLSKELRSRDVNDFIRGLLDYHHEPAIEFWLRCREQDPAIRFRFDYWESKVDFYEAIRRFEDAALAFRHEMRCRLNLLRSGKFTGHQVIFNTRKRLEYWLDQCANAELREIGGDIWRMVEQYEQNHLHQLPLLPRITRLQQFYREPFPAIGDARPRFGADLFDDEENGQCDPPTPAPPLRAWSEAGTPAIVGAATAIFIDVANLTGGSGANVLENLGTDHGDDAPGRFRLGTVLERIEGYARGLNSAPIAARWVVNYPPRSPAVMECNEHNYQVENVPLDLAQKGSDDHVLSHKVTEVAHGNPAISQFVLVAGDRDYRMTVEGLMKRGKHVHIIGRADSVARIYDQFARDYPRHCTVTRLEDLLTRGTAAPLETRR